jgi:hypothetical protein
VYICGVKKKLLLLGVALLSVNCATRYKTSEFLIAKAPKAPDYVKSASWAALPGQYPYALTEVVSTTTAIKPADVFYLYPTFLTDKKDARWNFDIWDPKARATITDVAIKYQASAWATTANLFVPFYRQAHYRIFSEPYTTAGAPAWALAYEDIKNAFSYYLENYNQGRPIIIAAHSQGSMHAKRLLQEFFDGTPLQQQLVAAYLPGAPIRERDFTTIKFMQTPDATGGFVSWNSYKKKHWPKNYASYLKGSYSTNPITWDQQTTGTATAHRGVLYYDGKIYPKSLTVENKDGLLWVSLPKLPKRIFLFWIKSYHYADINLFWADIAANAQRRIAAWYTKNKKRYVE